MSFHDLVRQRRTIKQFDPNHRLDKAHVQQLLDDAIHSPTSFNIQHWRFVHVSDEQLRADIRVAAFDQAQVTEASELFVIAADVNAWQKQPERYWHNVAPDTANMLVGMIGNFYGGREWIQRDEAIRSGALAAQTMMLSAKQMGYDTCAMVGFDQDKVGELIQLPDDHVIVMLLVVGKATCEPWPRGGQLALEEVVLENHF